MIHKVRSLVSSPPAVSAGFFGLSGLSFALANLLFARVFSLEDYATLALLVAFVMFTSLIGMLGADGIVNRYRMAADRTLFLRVFASTSFVATATAAVIHTVYDVSGELAVVLAPVIVTVTLSRFCAAYLRSHFRLALSLFLNGSVNFSLLVAAIAGSLQLISGVLETMLLLLVLQFAIGFAAVIFVLKEYREPVSGIAYPWPEAVYYLLFSGSAAVLIQMERLITPAVLNLSDLAMLGVLLAIAGPPFRLLQFALGYDLLPRLRSASSASQRQKLLFDRCRLAIYLIVPMWGLVAIVVPVADTFFLSDDYTLSLSLISSVLVVGTVKAFTGIGDSFLTALASARRLRAVGVQSWVSIVASVLGATVGSSYGLEGVVYGVGLGWVARLALAVATIRRQFRPVDT